MVSLPPIKIFNSLFSISFTVSPISKTFAKCICQLNKVIYYLLSLSKAGKFTYVSNTNNLRRDLATYYDFFSTNTIRDEPIVSIPYVDAFGTGKVLMGVCDTLLNELREHILGFKLSGNIFRGHSKETKLKLRRSYSP